jgi:hypothetical protein
MMIEMVGVIEDMACVNNWPNTWLTSAVF